MELGMYVVVALGALVLLWWMVYTPEQPEKEQPVVKPQVLLTEVQLKKKTKAQLLEIAGDAGITVDSKLTKAKIISELVK